jgi:plastocyanin
MLKIQVSQAFFVFGLTTLAATAGAASGVTAGGATQTLAANHIVTMKSISFDPKVEQIKVGDSVQWTNKSYTEHSATGEDGKTFDTGMVQPNKESKKIEFPKAGTFSYHCSVHGKTMSATIVVQP